MSRPSRPKLTDKQPPAPIQETMLGMVPSLRAFAISLCGNVDRADDLVQETLLRALTNIESFQPGTNLRGWLTTILRNQYLSEFRRRRNEVEDSDGQYVGGLKSIPEQDSRIEFEEFRAAVATLPFSQQEALLLVGALGLCSEEVAAICGTEVATIRGRIHRARKHLAKVLAISSVSDFGPDDRTRAVLNAKR